MIDEGIMKGTSVGTTDNTLKALSRFQNFPSRNFHNYEHYKDMQPESNQPARLYGTAKTHKFETLEDINVVNLKFQTIIYQTGMFTYNAAKVVSDYLRTLCKNEYSINDAQNFQACYLQFDLYKMIRKMYHMVLSHYLEIFR